MSQLYVDNIRNRTGGAINAPSGAVVTGVTTATGLDINGNGDVSGNLNIGGVLTYEDVNNVDSVGVITARQGIRVGGGQSIGSDGAAVVYYGDGSNLDGVVSGVEVKQDTTSKGTSIVSLDFSGATVTASGAGSTISIAAGVNTTASSPSANSVVTLNLTDFGHHDITLTAGITTITCTGGSMGQSHSLVLTQPSSGIATVGFSTYFLFPSGATPVMSEGNSKVDLVSFVVKQQGSSGVATALLASAGLNYQ
jgi:hypothetical protein